MADRRGLPHVVIENVAPEIDAGRHPAKGIVGDTLRVEADIFKDGHGLVAGRVRYRGPGDRRWQLAPLEYSYEPDRWSGSILLDRIGRWSFSVEAWPAAWVSTSRDRISLKSVER